MRDRGESLGEWDCVLWMMSAVSIYSPYASAYDDLRRTVEVITCSCNVIENLYFSANSKPASNSCIKPVFLTHYVTRILKLYSLHQRLSVFYKRKGRLWGRDGVKRYLFNIYQRSSGKKCLLHPLKVNTLVRQIEKLVMKFFLHLFKLSVSFDIINAKYIKDTFTLTDELTKFRQINQFNLMTYPLALKQRWLWPEKLLISECKFPSLMRHFILQNLNFIWDWATK